MSRVKKDKSNEFGFDSPSDKNVKDGIIYAREVLDAREKALRLLKEAQEKDQDKVTVQVKPGTWIRVMKGDDAQKIVTRFKDKTGIKN